MKLRSVWGLWALVGLVFACGGRSREAEAGDGKGNQAGATTGDACGAGKEAYHQQREQLLGELSERVCKADTDCGVLWENNACANTCGVTVPAGDIEAATQQLSALANEKCGSCAPIPTPPCVPPQPIRCKQGRCVDGP